MRFQREGISGVISEIGALAQKHFKEVGELYGFPLQPDLQAYQATEDVQALQIFTARNSDGRLVGYQIFIVAPHLFFSIKMATQNLLYIEPEERKCALPFLQYCDRELEKDGVQMIRQYVTVSKDFSSALKYLGYQEAERVFVRKV